MIFKFRRLLLRFERISQVHYAFKTLAYTMINLRHYCRGRSQRRARSFLSGAPRRDSPRPLHGANPRMMAPIISAPALLHPIFQVISYP
jgi:hypothetical protein